MQRIRSAFGSRYILRTHEMLAAGIGQGELRSALRRGSVARVRQGVYARRDTPPAVVAARPPALVMALPPAGDIASRAVVARAVTTGAARAGTRAIGARAIPRRVLAGAAPSRAVVPLAAVAAPATAVTPAGVAGRVALAVRVLLAHRSSSPFRPGRRVDRSGPSVARPVTPATLPPRCGPRAPSPSRAWRACRPGGPHRARPARSRSPPAPAVAPHAARRARARPPPHRCAAG